MYFIYTCHINLHIRGNGDYKKIEMERTVSRAFDSRERPETLCDEMNLVQRTEIERPLFLNLINFDGGFIYMLLRAGRMSEHVNIYLSYTIFLHLLWGLLKHIKNKRMGQKFLKRWNSNNTVKQYKIYLPMVNEHRIKQEDKITQNKSFG